MVRSPHECWNNARKWTLRLFLPLALLHIAYAFGVDYAVWQWWRQEEVFKWHPHPWQMNIVPYLPGCVVLDYGRRFDPHLLTYRRGADPHMTPIIKGIGLLALIGGALATGLFTASLVGRIACRVSRAWGRYSWRLCVAVVLWLGWITVPTSISLYYQWCHWMADIEIGIVQ